MPKSVLQEMFDKSVGGVIKQGGPSVDKTGGCQYRGQNGRKCGVGQLISDKRYREEMEGYQVKDLKSSWLRRRIVKNIDFVSELQSSHDDSWVLLSSNKTQDKHFMKAYIKSARRLANKYKLEWKFKPA